MSDHRVLLGDAEVALRQLAAEGVLVDTVVTSPPFWGLRDYGGWMMVRRWDPEGRGDPDLLASAFSSDSHKWRKRGARRRELELRVRASLHGGVECPDTGVRMDALGAEPTPDLYVRHLTLIFREVQRVLKPSGVMLLNLGDTYCGGGQGRGGKSHYIREAGVHTEKDKRHGIPSGHPWLRPKQLLLIPSRVAIALQEDGWLLRNDCIQAKTNAMPESVKDRFNNTYEHWFLFARQKQYWFDLDAVRRPAATVGDKAAHAFGPKSQADGAGGLATQGKDHSFHALGKNPGDVLRFDGQEVAKGSVFHKGKTATHQRGRSSDKPRTYSPLGSNPGDVLHFGTKPFSGAHFACFNPDLVEFLLKASCPPKVCGAKKTKLRLRRDLTDRQREEVVGMLKQRGLW